MVREMISYEVVSEDGGGRAGWTTESGPVGTELRSWLRKV